MLVGVEGAESLLQPLLVAGGSAGLNDVSFVSRLGWRDEFGSAQW